jgi:hypothetical protein
VVGLTLLARGSPPLEAVDPVPELLPELPLEALELLPEEFVPLPEELEPEEPEPEEPLPEEPEPEEPLPEGELFPPELELEPELPPKRMEPLTRTVLLPWSAR